MVSCADFYDGKDDDGGGHDHRKRRLSFHDEPRVPTHGKSQPDSTMGLVKKTVMSAREMAPAV